MTEEAKQDDINDWPLGIIECLHSDTIFVGTLAELKALNDKADQERDEGVILSTRPT